MPKTDVAYGPTKAFAKAFPKELAEQNEKFNQPSWQTRINAAEQLKAELPTPPPPRSCTPTVRQQDTTVPMLIGALFFAGLAYLAFRGVQWHLLTLE